MIGTGGRHWWWAAVTLAVTGMAAAEPQLLRESYFSTVTEAERDYYVYLPEGFETEPRWPVLLVLHGNGERGNGKDELDFVMVHGPLLEAWVYKRDLPFVIVAPQLPMYGMGEADYIRSRKLGDVPRRLERGTPPRAATFQANTPMLRAPGRATEELGVDGPPFGWPLHSDELLSMVDTAIESYRGDPTRVYVTGLSYGGFGTWYLAGRHPERFAAAAPVAGYGHPDLAPAIAGAGLPLWCFAGGRDPVVRVEYFYEAMNAIEARGHRNIRLTVEEDMSHDVWRRVYAGEDVYRWLLSHSK